jgi:ketosteroid isomerase-like protein
MQTRRPPFARIAASIIAVLCAGPQAAVALPVGDAQPSKPQAAQAPAAPAWPTDVAGLKALGTDLLSKWMGAIASSDAAAVSGMMQPGFLRVGFDGTVGHAEQLEAVKAMGAKNPKVTDVVATRVGDALVVTCQVSVTQTIGGKALDATPACRLGVWQPADGGWKLAAWATLHMPQPRPAPGAPRAAAGEAMGAPGAAMVKRFLDAQRAKDLAPFDAMLADGMQVVNFKGQKQKADLIKGASHATTTEPVIADARATKCGPLTVVACTLTMGQKIGWTTLPAAPAPFLCVFAGEGDSAKVIAMANTNRPE